jgi:hypothetical protein
MRSIDPLGGNMIRYMRSRKRQGVIIRENPHMMLVLNVIGYIVIHVRYTMLGLDAFIGCPVPQFDTGYKNI